MKKVHTVCDELERHWEGDNWRVALLGARSLHWSENFGWLKFSGADYLIPSSILLYYPYPFRCWCWWVQKKCMVMKSEEHLLTRVHYDVAPRLVERHLDGSTTRSSIQSQQVWIVRLRHRSVSVALLYYWKSASMLNPQQLLEVALAGSMGSEWPPHLTS
jgi:hypothetical protein